MLSSPCWLWQGRGRGEDGGGGGLASLRFVPLHGNERVWDLPVHGNMAQRFLTLHQFQASRLQMPGAGAHGPVDVYSLTVTLEQAGLPATPC